MGYLASGVAAPIFPRCYKGTDSYRNGLCKPQIDVIVLFPSYPRILLDNKFYLSGGVAAAFECKITLTAAHVRDAVETSAALKRSLPKREENPYKELHSGLLYGLLAHSHSWNAANSKPIREHRGCATGGRHSVCQAS